MKKLILSIILLTTLTACNKPDETKTFLKSQNYTDITIDNGYPPFTCANDEKNRTKFTAKNNNGKVVKGVVCEGVFTKPTIHLFN